MIEISNDYAALREHAKAYARELLTYRFAPQRVAEPQGGSIPAPYRRWLDYLMSVKLLSSTLGIREPGIAADPAIAPYGAWPAPYGVRADVAHGLQILDAALAEFAQSAKRCPRCGGLTESAYICEICGAKLQIGNR